MQRTVLLSQFYQPVCLSDRCVYCDKTKQHTADILIPHETAITLAVTPTVVGGRYPFPLKSALKVTHPFRKTPTSTDFVSTVEDSEKSSIMTNIKSTTGFPTSYILTAYVTPKYRMDGSKAIFFRFFELKSTADRVRPCQLSSPVNVINIWWSAAKLITFTVEICIQQLGRVEVVWLPYDAGLSAVA